MPWYMQWWAWGIAAGIVLPWLTFSKTLKIEEKGLQIGLGTWFGLSPLALGIMFVFKLIAGK